MFSNMFWKFSILPVALDAPTPNFIYPFSFHLADCYYFEALTGRRVEVLHQR